MLGRGEKQKAEWVLGNAFTAILLMTVFITVVLLCFAKEILFLFGASKETILYAEPYLRIYACGTIFVLLTLGLNTFISAQGFAKISMLTVGIGQ